MTSLVSSVSLSMLSGLYHSYFSVSPPNRDNLKDLHHPKPMELIYTKITLRDSEPQNPQRPQRVCHTCHNSTIRLSYQVHLQARKAPRRCWEVYRRCCITGTTSTSIRNDQPIDVIIHHIFPRVHWDLVCLLLVLSQTDN
jgi:hypothetical protein